MSSTTDVFYKLFCFVIVSLLYTVSDLHYRLASPSQSSSLWGWLARLLSELV